MGVTLTVTDGEILIVFVRCRSVALQLTIYKLLLKSLGGKPFCSWKMIISQSKPLKTDHHFNSKFFLSLNFGYSKSQVIVSLS